MMKYAVAMMTTLMLVGGVSAPVWADCRSDLQQAMQLVRQLGQNPNNQALQNQLEGVLRQMEANGCDSQVLQLYQTIQQQGIQLGG